MDEITEVFQSYADLKQAQKSGSIPIRFVCAMFRVPLMCSVNGSTQSIIIWVQSSETSFKLKAVLSFSSTKQSHFETGWRCFQAGVELALSPHNQAITYSAITCHPHRFERVPGTRLRHTHSCEESSQAIRATVSRVVASPPRSSLLAAACAGVFLSVLPFFSFSCLLAVGSRSFLFFQPFVEESPRNSERLTPTRVRTHATRLNSVIINPSSSLLLPLPSLPPSFGWHCAACFQKSSAHSSRCSTLTATAPWLPW